MVSVDLSIFLQIINFVILVLVLNTVMYKPLRGILLQRKEKIKGLEQGISTSLSSAQEKENAFSQGIKTARANGLKQKESIIEEAAREEKRMIDDIHSKSQAELTQIREKIQKDVDTVRGTLQKEIDAFAEAIGRKVLGRTI